MKELKEALTYAAINGITGFAMYTGAALFYGEAVMPAIIAGSGIGLLAFGSYMIREENEVELNVVDSLPVGGDRTKTQRLKQCATWVTPNCVRKHGLFHFF